MNAESIPVTVFFLDPDQLARMLPYNPEIRCRYWTCAGTYSEVGS